MGSFERLIDIGFQWLTQEEIAQIFLWYHLRKYPTKRTASIKRIQRYFEKADIQTPSDNLIRNNFFINKSIRSGSRNDTYSLEPYIVPWFDKRYGSCFEPQTFREKSRSFIERIINPKLAVWVGRIAFILFVITAIIVILSVFEKTMPG